ncbi:MAG TPA: ribonuclease Z [Saprospiraceae bacterium]|nr:ribonuclease Z [Saprospiraceae bacterium]
MAEFAVTVIGSGSALPMNGRHPSAQVVQYDEIFCLIDCGEGTQTRLRDSGIKPFKINVVLISHLHGDHVFGLPGLLSSFSHLQRKNELIVFGPAGIKGLLDEIIKYTALKINYPLQIIETDAKGLTKIWSKGNLDVFTFPLQHRINCNGYLLKERSALYKLKKDAVESLKLTPEQIHQLQQGGDLEINGRIVLNHELTYGAERPLSYAYCSDTQYSKRIIPWIKNVSVLYHETTFRNDLYETAEQTGHSTAGDAGRMASEAGALCLITGHYSSRYKDVADLIREAEVHFPHVLESIEGKKYSLKMLSQQLS